MAEGLVGLHAKSEGRNRPVGTALAANFAANLLPMRCLVRQAILRRLDVDELAAEQSAEAQERFALAVLRRQVEGLVGLSA